MTLRVPRLHLCTAAAILLGLALLASRAGAEDKPASNAPAPTAATAPVPPQPPPPQKPGFLQELKGWWDQSLGLFGKGFESTRSTVEDVGKKTGDVTKDAAGAAGDVMKGAVEATKNAATSIVKLPNTRMIEVHEHCDKAPNGAPDCETAAAKGCRAKGFTGGRPLDVRTEQRCDPATLASGQPPELRDCPIETTVTRAICQ